MSHKSAQIAARIRGFQGQDLDPHYLGFFDCFNRGQFYEAHDVLEELWLACRRGPEDAFYKGLIQLAGAFVHLQKHRLQPAGALFTLAARNLAGYPRGHHRLDVPAVLAMIAVWQGHVADAKPGEALLQHQPGPQLGLLPLP